MRGENVYLNPYSHIDQSPVEVRLARDSNGPELATRHVSVLLSFSVIDPAGLLSAAWIHSWASSPRYTAVTRHKEGSISTAPGIVSHPPPPPTHPPIHPPLPPPRPNLHAPSKSLHQPPGEKRGRDAQGQRDNKGRARRAREGGGRRERGGK